MDLLSFIMTAKDHLNKRVGRILYQFHFLVISNCKVPRSTGYTTLFKTYKWFCLSLGPDGYRDAMTILVFFGFVILLRMNLN